MSKILYLKTIDEIRCMTDPYRMKIYLIFRQHEEEGLTVKDIALKMGDSHGKVYYHVKKMLDLGALEIIRTKKINGITAKYYQTTFDDMEIVEEHSEDGQAMAMDSMKKIFKDIFDDNKQAFIKSALDQNVPANERELGENLPAIVSSDLNFTEESYKTFFDELNALVEKHKAPIEDGFTKKIFYTLYNNRE